MRILLPYNHIMNKIFIIFQRILLILFINFFCFDNCFAEGLYDFSCSKLKEALFQSEFIDTVDTGNTDLSVIIEGIEGNFILIEKKINQKLIRYKCSDEQLESMKKWSTGDIDFTSKGDGVTLFTYKVAKRLIDLGYFKENELIKILRRLNSINSLHMDPTQTYLTNNFIISVTTETGEKIFLFGYTRSRAKSENHASVEIVSELIKKKPANYEETFASGIDMQDTTPAYLNGIQRVEFSKNLITKLGKKLGTEGQKTFLMAILRGNFRDAPRVKDYEGFLRSEEPGMSYKVKVKGQFGKWRIHGLLKNKVLTLTKLIEKHE